VLSPQQTQTLQFTGRYRASNAAPMVFQLGGETCQTFVSPAPGAPSQPVEVLDNGTVRLGPVPTSNTPIPGISINPSGVAVPVPVNPSVPAGGNPTSTSPAVVIQPDDGDDDEEPVEPAPPTPTGTPSPSPTPTPTYAVSNWREEQFRVTATDCPAGLAKRVRDSLKNAKENYIVRARGLQSEIEDGNHNVLPAEIDADGVLHARYTTAQQVGNCVQIYTQEWQVDLRQSPSAASYSGVFRTQPCNNPVNCTQSITSRWTFKSGVQP
jgi:hypothetical protein